MPQYTLYLISLKAGVAVPDFFSALRAASIDPIFQAKAERWTILPHKLSVHKLLSRNTHWDLLILLHDKDQLPTSVRQSHIADLWVAQCGIPERFIKDYKTRNAEIIRPKGVQTRALSLDPPTNTKDRKFTSDSPVTLGGSAEFATDLSEWLDEQPEEKRSHPVVMWNLLSFLPGKREQYNKYGEAFSKTVGNRHGGRVKINGHVIEGKGERAQGRKDGWDEMVLVHYPTLSHFIAMSEDSDYQEANVTYRVGALRDTMILCVMEIDDEGQLLATKLGRETKL